MLLWAHGLAERPCKRSNFWIIAHDAYSSPGIIAAPFMVLRNRAKALTDGAEPKLRLPQGLGLG